jgi:hypothetical protein
VHRLLTQIQRLESRSGRRAASISVAVPLAIDARLVEEALGEHVDAEVLATHDAGAQVCRVTTVDFELLDEAPLRASNGGSK